MLGETCFERIRVLEIWQTTNSCTQHETRQTLDSDTAWHPDTRLWLANTAELERNAAGLYADRSEHSKVSPHLIFKRQPGKKRRYARKSLTVSATECAEGEKRRGLDRWRWVVVLAKHGTAAGTAAGTTARMSVLSDCVSI